MKQCIKTAEKQVWLYFIHRTMQLGYVGTTTNLLIVLSTQENLHLNLATQKTLAKFSYPKKSQNWKYQTTPQILWSSMSLEIQSTPSP